MRFSRREVVVRGALYGLFVLFGASFVAIPNASAIPLNTPMLKNQRALMPFVYPVMGPRLSSDYGMRKHPTKRVRRHHHGIDLAAPIDAPIRAIAGGRVMFADPWGGYGKLVVIQHTDGLTSHYGHCNVLNVQPGQTVRAGDIIGTVGNSGSSTGPHLHFEIRRKGEPTDPESILPGITSQVEG